MAIAFTTLNFLAFPNVVNAPATDDATFPDQSGDFVAASLIEIAGGPVFRVGFSILSIGGRLVSNRIGPNRVLVGAGRTLFTMSSEAIVYLNKIPVYLSGGLKDKAYTLFKRAAQIAGRNIDDLAEQIGYTNISVIPSFVNRINGNVTITLKSGLLENAIPEE